MASNYEPTELDKAQWLAFGLYFKALRESQGLSQKEMAKLLGTAQARVSGFERGEADFKISTAQNWARVFGLQIEFYCYPIDEVKGPEWEKEFKEALAESITNNQE